MIYGAPNTVTKADAEHACDSVSDVSNVGLLNWERQSFTFFSKYSPLYALHFRCRFTHLLKIALYQSWLYCEMMFAEAERKSGRDENRRPFNCDLTLWYNSKSNGARSGEYGHLALTVWMLLYEVVGWFDEYDKCSIGTHDWFIICAHFFIIVF